MKKTRIFVDKKELKNSGTIAVIKLSADNAHMLYDTAMNKDPEGSSRYSQIESIIDVIFGHIHSTGIFDASKIKEEKYNDEHTIQEYLDLLSQQLGEKFNCSDIINIEDIKRISTTDYNKKVNYVSFGTDRDRSMIAYINNNEKVNYDFFISKLLSHISKTKPLCLVENELSDEIIYAKQTAIDPEIDWKNLGNSKNFKKKSIDEFHAFLDNVVLRRQTIDGYDKTIEELLEEYNIEILDFEYTD